MMCVGGAEGMSQGYTGDPREGGFLACTVLWRVGLHQPPEAGTGHWASSGRVGARRRVGRTLAWLHKLGYTHLDLEENMARARYSKKGPESYPGKTAV